MKIVETGIKGLVEILPDVFPDSRGSFCELYNKERYRAVGILNDFCQENMSKSTYGVIRGLHFQLNPYSQAKLATCLDGRVYDVAVDLRVGSPTYGQWRGVILDAEKHNEFFIPQGFAHGFAVLSKTAIFNYRCDNLYHPETEGGIAYNDPDLNINWMIPTEQQIISEKDSHRTLLRDVKTNFVFE